MPTVCASVTGKPSLQRATTRHGLSAAGLSKCGQLLGSLIREGKKRSGWGGDASEVTPFTAHWDELQLPDSTPPSAGSMSTY